MREPTVAAGLMEALFSFAISKGANRRELIEAVGFEPGKTTLDDRLPYDSYVMLFRAAKRATGDGALALRFGEEVEMSSFSVVGLLGPPPGSVGQVIEYVNRYTRLLIDAPGQPPDRLRLWQAGSALWLLDARPEPNAFPELTESTFARMACTARRMGIRSPLAELQVTHDKPAHHAEYERIFQVPVRFGAARNAVRLGEELLKLMPAGIRPTYVQHLAVGHAEALLGRLDEQTTFRGRTAAAIENAMANGGVAVEAVAAEMGMSRQTLYRRLKEEGFTYEMLHDQIRCRRAISQLKSGCTVADVAHQLGFSDRAAFSRAFKRWTGVSPGRSLSL